MDSSYRNVIEKIGAIPGLEKLRKDIKFLSSFYNTGIIRLLITNYFQGKEYSKISPSAQDVPQLTPVILTTSFLYK